MSTATKNRPPKTSLPTKTRIIVLDDIATEGLEKLDAAAGIEYDIRTGLKGEELRDALQGYRGAVCRSGVKITAESLAGNTTLKAIVRAGVGTDNIDKTAATRLGIVVMNTPDGNTVSTAEHTMALLLGLSRNVGPAYASLAAGKWDRKKFKGSQVCGKTLGIVGLGRIGLEVCKRAKGFGMDIIGYDPFLSSERAEELGIRKVETVAELLPVIDYLTVHTPLTPETKGLISSAEIGQMKPGTRLINCARGGIYDHDALVAGLESGQLGGVALDVYENEPCTDSPLFNMPNVLCTPHLGASTEEAQIEVAVEAVDLLINFLTTGEIRSAVNTISLDPQTILSLKSYLEVAYRLGILMGQWHSGSMESCDISVLGEISDKDTRLLVSAFCSGLLGDKVEGANIVNAEVLCRERGIEITRTSSAEHGAFASVISVVVKGAGETLQAAGTVFGKNLPRLVQLNEYRLESFMDGNLLIFSHTDVPGIIGHVGQVLADDNVNVAQMALGRKGAAGSSAIGVLNLDNAASESALQKVAENKSVQSAIQISLPAVNELPEWLK